MLKQILKHPEDDLSKTKVDKVVPALFAYLFNRISLKKFLVFVEDQGYATRAEALRIKDVARENGYILKNCKLFAWACHCARRLNLKLPKPETFGVDAEDAKILRRLNLKHLDPYPQYRAYSLRTFDKTIQDLVQSSEMRNYIGKFVTKKMSFLINSYGESRHDIEGYLREMAIVALYKQYPRFDSGLHMVNVAKAQIHNKGHSFITSKTAKSRQKLLQNEDGSFEAVHVDIATLADVAAPMQYGLEIAERLQALAKIEIKLPDKTKEFLMAAAGHYHEGLSQFIGRANDVVADELSYAKYMKHLHAYFETTPERMEKVFANMRKAMMYTPAM